ncbi:hypothetical protein [Trujillonella humicola]|uniref:hypothetical protein n=1 Tax=Trujillonella humicola TaxID=3383699 RepID=UPI003906B1C0
MPQSEQRLRPARVLAEQFGQVQVLGSRVLVVALMAPPLVPDGAGLATATCDGRHAA